MTCAVLLLALLAVVPSLAAQTRPRVGDTVEIVFRANPGRATQVRGLLQELSTEVLVLALGDSALRVAREDVTSTHWLAGHGFDGRAATIPMIGGGLVGATIGVLAVMGDESITGAGALLVVGGTTVLGVGTGMWRGYDSHGRTGAGIGVMVGAVIGLAIGLATKPAYEGCNGGTGWWCTDFTWLYPVATTALGLGIGSPIGGLIGSSRPGDRWAKGELPAPSLSLRPLRGGRVGIGITTVF